MNNGDTLKQNRLTDSQLIRSPIFDIADELVASSMSVSQLTFVLASGWLRSSGLGLPTVETTTELRRRLPPETVTDY